MGYRLNRIAVAILILCLGSVAVAEPKVLARRKVLTAYLLNCDNTATLEITAPDGRLFSDTLGDFGVMVDSLKYIIPQACSSATKVTIKGTANGTLWFAGALKTSDQWKLVSLYSTP